MILKRKRVIYVIAGLLVMLFAGFVYAWRILSAPIAAEFTGWTSVQLAVTFTVCMAFFCLGGLAGGVLLNCAAPAFNVRLSAVLFLAGFLMAACSFLIRLPGAEAEISGKPGFTAGAEFSTGKMLRQPGFWCFFLWAAPPPARCMTPPAAMPPLLYF